MSQRAIVVDNISKLYQVGTARSGSLRETLGSLVRRKGRSGTHDYWALRDVSFELNQGEVLGVVGRNGAGKSTLLKILSRITEPTHGRIEINGRMGSLLEVGTGFHPELTGRENIFLNGAILGMKRAEIRARFDEIVAFSGVEQFLDTPVKRYSSGMYVRLAFAVAAHLEPEILVIDEVLAVGDVAFQKKCLGKMQEVAKAGRTVLFVSHHMGMVRELCTKGVMLKQGQLVFAGTAVETINHYVSDEESAGSQENYFLYNGATDLDAAIIESSLVDRNGNLCHSIDVFDPIYFKAKYKVNKPIEGLSFNLIVERNGEIVFLAFDTDKRTDLLKFRNTGFYQCSFKFPSPLKSGRYTVRFGLGILRLHGVHNPEKVFHFDVEERSFNESMKSYGSSRPGVIAVDTPWTIEEFPIETVV